MTRNFSLTYFRSIESSAPGYCLTHNIFHIVFSESGAFSHVTLRSQSRVYKEEAAQPLHQFHGTSVTEKRNTGCANQR